MNAVATQFLLEKYGKKNIPDIRPGDTVRVHQRIKEGAKERVQIFEGLVIATKHGKGLDGSFTVRKIGANSIGVERTYPVHSPNIIKVERTKTAEVGRAKLYYMRDRKGKAARFKNEVVNPASWVESAAVVEELEVIPEAVETPEEPTEVVIADQEGEEAASETPEIVEAPAEVEVAEAAPEESAEDAKTEEA